MIVKEIRILEPARPHKDVTDHLEAGLQLGQMVKCDLAEYIVKHAKSPATPAQAQEPEPRPPLRLVVDRETGEVVEPHTCPACQALEDQLNGAQREIRGWRSRYAVLAREKDEEARASEFWPMAVALFGVWKELTRHLRSQWTYDRYHTCEPLLKKYGLEVCERAIAGIAFDPYLRPMRNGGIKRYDDWATVFKDAGRLEEYANRAPRDWKPSLQTATFMRMRVAPEAEAQEADG